MSLFNSNCFKVGTPNKLIVFIHGYNGNPEDIEYAEKWLENYVENAVIVLPRAPFACEKNKEKLQWLSFYKVDPDVRFRNPEASVEEIFDIFDRVGADFENVAEQLNQFIDEKQKEFGIGDENTFIMGFSQGAMLSIYTALTRKHCVAGCIPIAGIITDISRLADKIVSRPKFLIMHGRDDATVQYKTLPTTINWFSNNKLDFVKYEFDNLAHRMSENEMKTAGEFIKENT